MMFGNTKFQSPDGEGFINNYDEKSEQCSNVCDNEFAKTKPNTKEH